MQLLIIFSLGELELQSFIRAWEPAWKIQTSNYQVKVYFMTKFAENHDFNDIKDLRIS